VGIRTDVQHQTFPRRIKLHKPSTTNSRPCDGANQVRPLGLVHAKSSTASEYLFGGVGAGIITSVYRPAIKLQPRHGPLFTHQLTCGGGVSVFSALAYLLYSYGDELLTLSTDSSR
jgi:hypothetical protein